MNIHKIPILHELAQPYRETDSELAPTSIPTLMIADLSPDQLSHAVKRPGSEPELAAEITKETKDLSRSRRYLTAALGGLAGLGLGVALWIGGEAVDSTDDQYQVTTSSEFDMNYQDPLMADVLKVVAMAASTAGGTKAGHRLATKLAPTYARQRARANIRNDLDAD